MLDIVITHYQEPWEVGEKLFLSIALQRCIDFNDIRVTVINDGGHRIPEEKLSGLPYPVEQVDIPHGGISRARNTGIERAKEPWIMFCDFDDSFASIYALDAVLPLLHTDQYDMLWSKIIEEDHVDGKRLLYYAPDKQKFVFCHGKVYRTAFLHESGIRFDESLVYNEDSCFNAVIIARVPFKRIGAIQSSMPIYCWIRRIGSVMNSGGKDDIAYALFMRNLIVTGEYENTKDNRLYGMVTRTAYDTYYMVFGRRVSPQMSRWLVDEFTPWIADRIGMFGKVSDDDIKEIMAVSRFELTDPDEVIPDDIGTVRKWLDSLVYIYCKAR